MPEQSRNKIYLDLLRILAIFLVVYNHTPGYRFLPYTEWHEMSYWGMLIQNQIVKMAVPLFLLISGALLLHKEENCSSLIRRRILRFGLAIFIVTLIQWAFYIYWKDEPCEVHVLVRKLFFGQAGFNSFNASWYLYAYMGLLLTLPVWRAIAKSLSDSSFLYILGVQFVFCCVIPVCLMCYLGKYMQYSCFNVWLPFHQQGIYRPFSAGYLVFYMMMGYFLEHRVPLEFYRKHEDKFILLAFACIFAGVVCMEVARHYLAVAKLHESNIFLTTFLPIPIAVTYMSIKSACFNKDFKAIKRIIASLGSAVFAVMCFENLFRVKWKAIYQGLEPEIGRVPAALLYAFAICGACLIVGLVIKRIPFINRIF